MRIVNNEEFECFYFKTLFLTLSFLKKMQQIISNGISITLIVNNFRSDILKTYELNKLA